MSFNIQYKVDSLKLFKNLRFFEMSMNSTHNQKFLF